MNNKKLSEGIQNLILNDKLQFFGEFALNIIFKESNKIDTAGVTFEKQHMICYYNDKFINSLSDKEVIFILLHEIHHLILCHINRSSNSYYNKKLSNIAQDAIINDMILRELKNIDISFVPKMKDKDVPNCIFIDKDYNDEKIFEIYYDYLKKKKEDYDKNNQSNNCEYDFDNQIKDPKTYDSNMNGIPLDMIFDDLNLNNGEYLDVHLDSNVSEQLAKQIVNNTIQQLKNKGLVTSNIENTIKKLQKKRKDYLKEIKRGIETYIFGNKKYKTIKRPNRREIFGLKGSKHCSNTINVILDTSGSMYDNIDNVLSYIYKNDIDINLIQIDIEVKDDKHLKNTSNALTNVTLKGFGGTILQPALDLIKEKYNRYNNLILTDGYCDNLDFNDIKGKTMIISCGTEVSYYNNSSKIKQILISSF